MAAEANYCPFCGARLPDEDEPLFDHLYSSEECGDRFQSWEYGGGAPREDVGSRNPVRSAVMWVIILVVLGYSLIIVQQLLLGVVAAGFVYLAFRWEAIAIRLSQ